MNTKVIIQRYLYVNISYDKLKPPHNKCRNFAIIVKSHGGSRKAVTIKGDSVAGVFTSSDPTLQPRVTLHGVITQ